MKPKIKVLILLLIGVFIFYKRYEIYYFLQGKVYLRPNETLELTVNPRYDQIEYYSDLHIESNEEIMLKLEGRDIWAESTTKREYITFGDVFYYYNVKEQTIEKSADDTSSGSIPVETGYKGTTVDKDGIIVPLKGKRIYGVTEDHDYTITITNLSDKPVAFSATVENH